MMILLAYVLSAVLIFFDQITKILIKNWIPLGQSLPSSRVFWIFILLTHRSSI